MLVRYLVDKVLNQNHTVRVKNLLHLTVYNQGNNDIKVRGAIIKPGNSWNLPDGAGIPMHSDFEANIEVTDNTSSYYLSYTTLGTEENC